MDDVNVSQNKTEAVSCQTDATLKVIKSEEKRIAEELSIDFGGCVGTATIDGELDVRKFIDAAMELPTLKKKYGGRKMTIN